MKKCIKNVKCLIQLLSLMLAGQLAGQTFTVIHNFSGTNGVASTNTDGASPRGSLVLSGATLYGTAPFGGDFGNGAVFRVQTDGAGFSTLHSFTATNGAPSTDSDGATPQAGLVLTGTTLFGTASAGGSLGSGTIFAIDTNGTGFKTLHNFDQLNASTATILGSSVLTNTDGANPVTRLLLAQGVIYGTARVGGSFGSGTVFSLTTNGTDFKPLHTFTGLPSGYPFINSDGAYPFGVVLSGTNLFGTSDSGGSTGWGTVFTFDTSGTSYRLLGTFNPNANGANPDAGLLLHGKTVYGVAYGGSNNGHNGIVYAINTDGTDFLTLHTFSGSPNEGATPLCDLILSGETLYGTTQQGGTGNAGTVFAVNVDGTGFATLYNFTGGSDGALPLAGLVLSGTTLYGTTSAGGVFGSGTLFSLAFPAPQLDIIPYGTNVVLTWPTSFAGFSYSAFALRVTTDLAPPVVWRPVSPEPVVIGGQNVVILPVSVTQQFFRLSQ